MTIISVFGILLGLLAIPALFRGSTFSTITIALVIAAVHVVASFYYYMWTKTNLADAWAYYYSDSLWSAARWHGTVLGTVFAGSLTQFFKHSLGATYLDCYMIYQAFGTWGLLILFRLFHEIQQKSLVPIGSRIPLLLFVPSMNFWTSAIGKDAPIFFCVSLCTWAMMNFSKRWIALGLSLGGMVLFRAHIALAAGIALSLAWMFHKEFSLGKKALLLVVALIGTVFLLSAVQSTFAVDLTDPTSLNHFMDSKSAAELTDTANSSIGQAGFPLRLISLLFRPFFVDAKNAVSLVASVENLGSAALFIYLALHFRDVRQLSRQVLFVRFVLFFATILIVILAILNYNIGLGLRERIQAMPPLFSLFVAAFAYGRRKAMAVQQGYGPPAHAGATRVAVANRSASTSPGA